MLLFTVIAWGQTDSTRYATFKKQLLTKSNSKEKLLVYDSIIKYGEKLGYPKDFEAYALAGIALSKKLKDNVSLAHKTTFLMSYYNTSKGTPEATEPYAQQVFKMDKKGVYAKDLGNVYMYYGESLYYTGKSKEAIPYIEKALKIFVDSKDKRSEGFARLYLSWPLGSLGEFAKASIELQKSLRVFEELQDNKAIYSARSELATLYSKNNFIKEAKKERAFLFKDKSIDTFTKAILYFNQGTDEGKTGNLKQQVENYKTAMAEAKKTPNANILVPIALLELTTKLYELDRPEEAAAYFATFHKEFPGQNDYHKNSYLGALTAQSIYAADWTKAKRLLQEQIKNNKSNNDWENLMSAQKKYVQVLEKLGDYRNALTTHLAYTHLKDSIMDVQKANGLSYYQTLYETEKRDKIISKQQADLDLLDAKRKASERLLYIAVIAAISVIGITLLLIKQRQARKEQKLQEQFSRHLLQTQEEERTKISRDLHDSLGQQLILLKQTSQKEAQEAMTVQIENALTEMRSITRQLHPVLLKQLGLKATLEDLINRIDEQSQIFFTHKIEAIDGLLTYEEELNLYRFFQESLNNILKHSRATEVDILVSKQDKNISISIEDNGVGFVVKEKINNTQHLGLKTMEERIKILSGIFTIRSVPNEYTLLKANVPLN